jgi:RNA polymerase sigma-70 factor (ECF subfamily)
VDGLASSPPTLPSATVPQELSCLEAYQSEFDYLYRTLRRLGVRAEDLEDQAQEIFLVLNRKWPEYDPSRPLRPYLFGIAFRVVAAGRRKQRREEPRTLEELPDGREHPDEALDAARKRALVLRALARIPLPRRAVFVMHDIDETPMREIAQALSLPLFTGYSRLRAARREFEAAVRALQEGTREP